MSYDAATADRICSLLMEGKSLRSICRTKGMPALRSVFEWLEAQPEFRTKYARARVIQAEVLVDEMIDIADDKGELVARSKLKLEQRRWNAEKLLPKKYGQKLDLSHSGSMKVIRVREITSPEEQAAAWTKPTP